jgi:uncharacterized protein (DUF1499 family)
LFSSSVNAACAEAKSPYSIKIVPKGTCHPDIRTLVSDIPPAQTYERARSVARRMCWNIVDENQAEGRIEATATTRWFGFKDDVVIRIAPSAGNGSRVDIRSVSRVGRSDVGTNTRRIRDFLKKFTEASKTGG